MRRARCAVIEVPRCVTAHLMTMNYRWACLTARLGRKEIESALLGVICIHSRLPWVCQVRHEGFLTGGAAGALNQQ